MNNTWGASSAIDSRYMNTISPDDNDYDTLDESVVEDASSFYHTLDPSESFNELSQLDAENYHHIQRFPCTKFPGSPTNMLGFDGQLNTNEYGQLQPEGSKGGNSINGDPEYHALEEQS